MTRPKKTGRINGTSTSLFTLTNAALILPGLLQPTAYAAEDDGVDFQYSHYQEGKRDISGLAYDFNGGFYSTKLPNKLNPIEVDSTHGSGRFTLTERIKFAFNYTQDTWSGATPISTAPLGSGSNRPVFRYTKPDSSAGIIIGASPLAKDQVQFFLDKNLNIYQHGGPDSTTGQIIPGSKNNKLVHTLSYASPETRKQGDFKLSYEWDEAAVDVGGGISVENDYESRFVNLGGRMDFNQKQTTVNLGLSYTNSDTFATLDPDGLQFFDTTKYDNSYLDSSEDSSGNTIFKIVPKNPLVSAGEIDSTYQFRENGQFSLTSAILRGNRQDWSTQLGLTQVLNKDAALELNMGYTRSTGYLGNPYKLVSVISASGSTEVIQANKPFQAGRYSTLEIRPDERNQLNWAIGYNQYFEPFDAALHFDYRFTHDDWGIHAHTFEADWVQPLSSGWMVTPRFRYYSQSSADFYAPVFFELYQEDVYNQETGEVIVPGRYIKKLPEIYSSDQRLSGFGTLSGGVTVSKQFSKGVSLETGFEYYTHQGGLKLGGGEGKFADFDFWVANVALKINLDAVAGSGDSLHASHNHQHSNSPAGVMFDHALEKSGDFMVGYRYMRNEQAGDMLLGSQAVTPDEVRFNACGDQECMVAPKQMTMAMHMLDLMYAPTDWLSVMLMPQWVDMEMNMIPLVEHVGHGHNHGGAVHSHQTGGVGDTGLYALFKLFDHPQHHITLSLGGTAPTGDNQVMLRKTNTNPYPAFIHYGMQLGSGTWDFKPSLTYTGNVDDFSWGTQVTGTLRLEGSNSSNFAFGDSFQSSVWGGYHWTNWLATTVRGVYTWQDSIRGDYPPIIDDSYGYPYTPTHVGPFDNTSNYGGQYVDLGLGINVTIPSGAFVGNTLKFEWLQPLHTDYNGYQLDRDGALNFTWSYGF
ncbi:MAG: DUF3570 domain-containing protein [Methyloglobulus sp.]|nr:DUF3570 domain-containing protein [Methyloglobulus sp.]